MEIKKIKNNTYRKLNWFEKYENISVTLMAIAFWAVVLTALFI